jgi:hypothetical protein
MGRHCLRIDVDHDLEDVAAVWNRHSSVCSGRVSLDRANSMTGTVDALNVSTMGGSVPGGMIFSNDWALNGKRPSRRPRR